MSYFPGHQYFLRAIASNTGINEATGELTNAEVSTDPEAIDIGYTAPSEVTSDEGTKIGYAAGRRQGSYAMRGARTHSLAAELRLGSVEFIKDFCTQVAGYPPYVDLFFGVSGQWTEGLYCARCSRLGLAFKEGGGQELTASASFEAIARATAATVTTSYGFEEFGPALLWTDVRTFTVDGVALRDKVMGLTVDLDHQLERKGVRPDFGDDVPGSRTSYALLPHHAAVSGSLQLHDLPSHQAALFTDDPNSMDWSNIVIGVTDVTGDAVYNLTISNPRPVSRQQGSVESSAQMSFTIPFVADGIAITN